MKASRGAGFRRKLERMELSEGDMVAASDLVICMLM